MAEWYHRSRSSPNAGVRRGAHTDTSDLADDHPDAVAYCYSQANANPQAYGHTHAHRYT